MPQKQTAVPVFAMHVKYENFSRTVRSLSDLRREINKGMLNDVREAAEETILPIAKRKTGHLRIADVPVAPALVIRGRIKSVMLTARFRGFRAQALGLLEFGGKVRTPIRPKNKKALSFGGGHPVASVKTIREYRAGRYLQSARDVGLNRFGENLKDKIVYRFRREGLELS